MAVALDKKAQSIAIFDLKPRACRNFTVVKWKLGLRTVTELYKRVKTSFVSVSGAYESTADHSVDPIYSSLTMCTAVLKVERYKESRHHTTLTL